MNVLELWLDARCTLGWGPMKIAKMKALLGSIEIFQSDGSVYSPKWVKKTGSAVICFKNTVSYASTECKNGEQDTEESSHFIISK